LVGGGRGWCLLIQLKKIKFGLKQTSEHLCTSQALPWLLLLVKGTNMMQMVNKPTDYVWNTVVKAPFSKYSWGVKV
jgi:hypothetical protein